MSVLVAFHQNVISHIENTFLNRNGYLPEIFLAGEIVDQSVVCETINVSRSEGDSSQASFVLKGVVGVQNFDQYLGKQVLINIRTSSSYKRIFTGYLDNYTTDLIEQKTKFDCSDRRNSKINNLNYNIIQGIGQYSRFIFGGAVDKADELSKRLSTVAGSFDFDVAGNGVYTEWEPKSTADFVLSDSSIYYEKPEIRYGDPSKVLNTVNISITYQYKRLHQQIALCTWTGYSDFVRNWFNQGSPSFPTRTMIQSAANATSWNVLNSIYFVDLWPAGSYSGIVWQPDEVSYTYKKKQTIQYVYWQNPSNSADLRITWPDGNRYGAVYDVLDSNGNPIYEVDSIITVNTSANLCRGASWAASKRFAQTINELYSIKLTSPQSVNKFDTIAKYESYVVNDPYDTSGWEQNRTKYVVGAKESVITGTITIDNAGYDTGDRELGLVATGSGVFYAGNQFTIDGDPSGQIYTVAENVTIGGTGPLKITNPGLGGELSEAQYTITILPVTDNYATNMFINKRDHSYWLAETLAVACKKAEIAIKQAHRNTIVSFRRSLWPEIDLQHTVETTATRISCKGKVSKINHFIDVKSGEAYTNVELLLSRSFGEDDQSVYAVQSPPYEDYTYIGNPIQVTLPTHYGEDPNPETNPVAINWTGYIGNASDGTITNQRTTYQESFIVNYPTLATALTAPKTITANTPGTAAGVETDNAGYATGTTSITLNSGGTGSIKQGDTITITGDSSGQVYVVQSDILDVSSGGVLNIQPGLQSTLAATNYPIVVSQPANQFTVNVPNDSISVQFVDE